MRFNSKRRIEQAQVVLKRGQLLEFHREKDLDENILPPICCQGKWAPENCSGWLKVIVIYYGKAASQDQLINCLIDLLLNFAPLYVKPCVLIF